MKIACNYSLETEELVNEQLIDIDYYKYPGLGFHTNLMKKENRNDFKFLANRLSKPILLHGVYPAPHNLSDPNLINNFDFETVNDLIEITKTPGLSFHPTLTVVDPATDKDELVKTIIKNLNFIKQHYCHLNFISLENVDGNRFGSLIKPNIFNRILSETDCRFLLDISHAYCASRYLNEDFREYLYKFDLSRVYEIHINGWMIKDNIMMAHTKIHEEGYEILKEVLKETKPEIITVEYGRHYDKLDVGIPILTVDRVNERAKEEIREQVRRIREMLGLG